MEWVLKQHYIDITRDLLYYYEAVNGTRACRIWLGTKNDKRSTCWLQFNRLEDDGKYYSDLVKEDIVCIRYWEAKRIAERWLAKGE